MAELIPVSVFVKGMWPDEDADEGNDIGVFWFLFVPRSGEDFLVRREFDHFVQEHDAHVRVVSVLQNASTTERHSWVQLYCEPFDAEALEKLRRLWPQDDQS